MFNFNNFLVINKEFDKIIIISFQYLNIFSKLLFIENEK